MRPMRIVDLPVKLVNAFVRSNLKKRQGWSRFEQSAQQLLQLPAVNVFTNERGRAVVVRSGEHVFL